MARVRVLAWKLGIDRVQVPRLAYSAQIYEDADDDTPVWTCIHEHRTPVDAQLCGIQFLTDRAVGHPKRGVA